MFFFEKSGISIYLIIQVSEKGTKSRKLFFELIKMNNEWKN